jgi:mannose-6-phosphate isomerase-like protein (cupin superfamily)
VGAALLAFSARAATVVAPRFKVDFTWPKPLLSHWIPGQAVGVPVAEHDLVSEVYHIMEGEATLVTGPEIVSMERRPSTNDNVRNLNGPGSNRTPIRAGVAYRLKPGAVIVIPAGVGHWFARIDDHIRSLIIPHRT